MGTRKSLNSGATGATREIFIVDRMKVSQVLNEMIPTLEALFTTVFFAEIAWEPDLAHSFMDCHVPKECILAIEAFTTAFVVALNDCVTT